jgi:hypothetical protein
MFRVEAAIIGETVETRLPTYTRGEIEIEGTFVVEQGSYLIKGPLSEIYQQKADKFDKLWAMLREYKPMRVQTYAPKADTRLVVKVDDAVFSFLSDHDDTRNEFRITPSYDPNGYQILKRGDYLVVTGNSFYRVSGLAFDTTYEMSVMSGGNKKKTPAKTAKWTRTGRKVTVQGSRGKPSTVKTVYRNTTTGEQRVRKMVARPDGSRRVSYVKF